MYIKSAPDHFKFQIILQDATEEGAQKVGCQIFLNILFLRGREID